MTIVSTRVQEALARMRPVDWRTKKTYRWEAAVIWRDDRMYDPENVLSQDSVWGLANRACKVFLGIETFRHIEFDYPGGVAYCKAGDKIMLLPTHLQQPCVVLHEVAHLYVRDLWLPHRDKWAKTYMDLLSSECYVDRDYLQQTYEQMVLA